MTEVNDRPLMEWRRLPILPDTFLAEWMKDYSENYPDASEEELESHFGKGLEHVAGICSHLMPSVIKQAPWYKQIPMKLAFLVTVNNGEDEIGEEVTVASIKACYTQVLEQRGKTE